MDEKLAFKKMDNVTFEQAATLGVGLLVSFSGPSSSSKSLVTVLNI
jgi:hypothetical protein